MVDLDDNYISLDEDESGGSCSSTDDEAAPSKPVNHPIKQTKYKLKFDEDDSDEEEGDEKLVENGTNSQKVEQKLPEPMEVDNENGSEERHMHKNAQMQSTSERKKVSSTSSTPDRRSRASSSSSRKSSKKSRSRSSSSSSRRSSIPPQKKSASSSSGKRSSSSRSRSMSRKRSRTPQRREGRSRSRSPARKRSAPPSPPRKYRKREPSEEERKPRGFKSFDPLEKKRKEDYFWKESRNRRAKIQERGASRVWGRSPTHAELEDVYMEHEEEDRRAVEVRKELERIERRRLKEKKNEEKKKNLKFPNDMASSEEQAPSDSDDKKRKKKHKKHKKEKANKKEKKRDKKKQKKAKKYESASEGSVILTDNDSETEEIWVEKTKEIAEEEAKKAQEEEAQQIGPQLPAHLLPKESQEVKYDQRSRDILRGEEARFAAYIAQGKRIPRRGEIGLTSSEIDYYEKAGYVMSGTRHKTMEATRLKKESQVLTAEEKRLLSGFTQEQRKRKEDMILDQFKELVASKKKKE